MRIMNYIRKNKKFVASAVCVGGVGGVIATKLVIEPALEPLLERYAERHMEPAGVFRSGADLDGNGHKDMAKTVDGELETYLNQGHRSYRIVRPNELSPEKAKEMEKRVAEMPNVHRFYVGGLAFLMHLPTETEARYRAFESTRESM